MEWPKIVPELTVLDFDKSIVFYTEVLGFKILNQRMQPKFAYLTLGAAHLMIEEHHSAGWNIAEMHYPLGIGFNLQIECDSTDKLIERLTQTNISLYRETQEVWYNVSDTMQSGVKEFLVQDPSGYLLRFSEYIGERPIIK